MVPRSSEAVGKSSTKYDYDGCGDGDIQLDIYTFKDGANMYELKLQPLVTHFRLPKKHGLHEAGESVTLTRRKEIENQIRSIARPKT